MKARIVLFIFVLTVLLIMGVSLYSTGREMLQQWRAKEARIVEIMQP